MIRARSVIRHTSGDRFVKQGIRVRALLNPGWRRKLRRWNTGWELLNHANPATSAGNALLRLLQSSTPAA
jgi:hypothetical protein